MKIVSKGGGVLLIWLFRWVIVLTDVDNVDDGFAKIAIAKYPLDLDNKIPWKD